MPRYYKGWCQKIQLLYGDLFKSLEGVKSEKLTQEKTAAKYDASQRTI